MTRESASDRYGSGGGGAPGAADGVADSCSCFASDWSLDHSFLGYGYGCGCGSETCDYCAPTRSPGGIEPEERCRHCSRTCARDPCAFLSEPPMSN